MTREEAEGKTVMGGEQVEVSDLISRQAAIDHLIDALYDLDEADLIDKVFFEEELKRVPAVQPEQKTGQWLIFDEDTWECSECKDLFTTLAGTPKDNNFHYCPNCGAKMESEEKENDKMR